ncbi:MAG: hydrogenase iron-sulfur subunit [Kiritimatiellia bacterium]|nr:hydrogenase iron-sulfur subunit [Kiritimatiellia bacterium]
MSKVKTLNKRDAVGIVLCDCGGQLRKRLDFARLKRELNKETRVVSVAVCSDLCVGRQCVAAIRAATSGGVKRLVVAACARDKIQKPFLEALAERKLNDGLSWIVNIREPCALAYKDKGQATAKAGECILAGVRRVQLAQPVKARSRPLDRNVAVIGAGVAGLQAAAALAGLGYRVALLHSGRELGGVAGAMPELFGYVGVGPDDSFTKVKALVNDLVARVRQSKNVSVYSNMLVKAVRGEAGNFSVIAATRSDTSERAADGDKVLKASAVVIAAGCDCAPALQTAWAEGSCIVGVDDLLQRVRHGPLSGKVAIVMDTAGEQGRAVSAQVLSIAERITGRAGVQVKLFCRNARVAAVGLEALYRRARQTGLLVVKGDKAPAITLNGPTALLRWKDEIIDGELTDEFDLVAVADLSPRPGAGMPSGGIVAGLRPGPDGAAQYDNVRLLPVGTNRPGVFVAGSARGNSELRDALTDGLAAAAQAHALLWPGRMQVRDDAAKVDTAKCVLCLTCVRICPHGAVSVDEEKKAADVSPVSCRRCGTCAAECPAYAITLPGYTDEQLAVEAGANPRVIVFACENSAFPAAEAAGAAGMGYGSSVQLIRVPCAGDVSPRNVLAALEKGAQKVVVMGCHPESCLYLSGSCRASGRMGRLQGMLEKAGVDKARVSFIGLAPVEPVKFIEYVKELRK